MHFHQPLFRKSSLAWLALATALAVVAPRLVHAEALLVVEADTGKVLQAENATYPWYPASVTKLMTAYVTLKAVKEAEDITESEQIRQAINDWLRKKGVTKKARNRRARTQRKG